MECLNCKKDVPQVEGKRPRFYCSPTCKSEYYRNKNAPATGKRGPGRPKKTSESALNEALNYPRSAEQEKALQEAFRPIVEKAESEGLINEFMGHPIPKNLKGIDLTIWKAEIKAQSKLK